MNTSKFIYIGDVSYIDRPEGGAGIASVKTCAEFLPSPELLATAWNLWPLDLPSIPKLLALLHRHRPGPGTLTGYPRPCPDARPEPLAPGPSGYSRNFRPCPRADSRAEAHVPFRPSLTPLCLPLYILIPLLPYVLGLALI